MAGSAGSLVTSAGTWTFDTTSNGYGNPILLNGQSASGGSAVELEVASGGNLYADNAQGQWWKWNGSGWTGSANPSTSVMKSAAIRANTQIGRASCRASVSADGSTLMAEKAGRLVTKAESCKIEKT